MSDQIKAYVLRQGEALQSRLAAGQIVRILADDAQTAGGFGALEMEATIDPQPIPLHYHNDEHDTWLCTRGRLKVWCEDECRVLTPGDFAYVKPGEVHSYQAMSPRTSFFGIVAPGGWEAFFMIAGDQWDEPGLPAINHPFDFSKMGKAMAMYDVHPVQGRSYAAATDWTDADRNMPKANQSYFLEDGHGPRVRARGHICTTLLGRDTADGSMEMRVVEGPRGASMPAMKHDKTHVFLRMLEGQLRFTLNGEETTLSAGDSANIPAGTAYSTQVTSGQARWCLASAHGNGLDAWNRLGQDTPYYTPAATSESDRVDGEDLAGVDVTLV